MTLKDFFESGIDLSCNMAIRFYFKHMPEQSVYYEIPSALVGEPDKLAEECKEKCKFYLDCSVRTICAGIGNDGAALLLISAA